MTRTRAADSWRIPIARTMVAVGLAVMCQAAAARAASFSVNPTQIFLSGTVKSALLTLKNETAEPLRFQVSMMAWGQDPDGKMLLTPTEDMVFFPALLTLGPHEERKIRVGTTVAPGALEKCYRIFVEELPPLENARPSAGVTMRTKMGIPIFLQPTRTSAQVRLDRVALADNHVTFRLLNTGTVHFTPEAVRVRGIDGSGASVGELAADAWYVLAEGRRDFDVTVPAARCSEIRSLTVEVQALGRTLADTVPAPNGACARQRP